MKKHAKIKIFGRVQGVNFRTAARNKAEELELFGVVRNEPDGTVYAEAEGGEEELEEFIAWCRRGPESSKVEKVETDLKDKLENYRSFAITF